MQAFHYDAEHHNRPYWPCSSSVNYISWHTKSGTGLQRWHHLVKLCKDSEVRCVMQQMGCTEMLVFFWALVWKCLISLLNFSKSKETTHLHLKWLEGWEFVYLFNMELYIYHDIMATYTLQISGVTTAFKCGSESRKIIVPCVYRTEHSLPYFSKLCVFRTRLRSKRWTDNQMYMAYIMELYHRIIFDIIFLIKSFVTMWKSKQIYPLTIQWMLILSAQLSFRLVADCILLIE